jgi:hypothetical protein
MVEPAKRWLCSDFSARILDACPVTSLLLRLTLSSETGSYTQVRYQVGAELKSSTLLFSINSTSEGR